MSHNSFGHLFRVTTFGESHGPAIGCVVDGCPPLLPLIEADIQAWLDHRKPGQSRFTTQRREPDTVKILSGVFTDETGTLQVHRFPIGIEHSLIKNILFLRAGTLIDTRGNVAITTGFGLSLSERASLDAAYQHDMLPELRPEFGPAQTFVLSLALGF